MFEVNNKDTRMTPLASLYFTLCSSVSIIKFEHVIADQDIYNATSQLRMSEDDQENGSLLT